MIPLTSTQQDFELVAVPSGALSLRSRRFGETFHPGVGPMEEARLLHVIQQRLAERASQCEGHFVVWDVGFGAGANALAVLEAFSGMQRRCNVEIHSFDLTLDPILFALANQKALSYLHPHLVALTEIVEQGEWQTSGVRWKLHLGDFRSFEASAPAPHAILYDPYSPQSNPEMWTLDHFRNLRSRLSEDAPCLLTNYTRSTAVRVTLLLAGFFVGRGAPTGEKSETTLASNKLSMLESPLRREWLERVRRSTAASPLRGGAAAPISEDDFQLLAEHGQFA